MLGEVVSYKEDRLGEMVGEFEECLVGLWEERENCKGKDNNKIEVKKCGVNGVNNGNVNNIVGGNNVRGYASNNGQQSMNVNVNTHNVNNNNNYNSNRQPTQGISRQLQPPTSANPSKPY